MTTKAPQNGSREHREYQKSLRQLAGIAEKMAGDAERRGANAEAARWLSVAVFLRDLATSKVVVTQPRLF